LCDNSAVREENWGLHWSDYEGEDMRTFGTFLAVGILALTAGCGGSGSPTGIDGGKGAGGGGGGISGSGGAGGVLGGNGGAGGTTSTGACNYPSCVASLAATCAPSGTCVEQSDATTFATNDCYSNGVKVLTTLNLTSGSAVVTVQEWKHDLLLHRSGVNQRNDFHPHRQECCWSDRSPQGPRTIAARHPSPPSPAPGGRPSRSIPPATHRAPLRRRRVRPEPALPRLVQL
jgi:hypothetical protein